MGLTKPRGLSCFDKPVLSVVEACPEQSRRGLSPNGGFPHRGVFPFALSLSEKERKGNGKPLQSPFTASQRLTSPCLSAYVNQPKERYASDLLRDPR